MTATTTTPTNIKRPAIRRLTETKAGPKTTEFMLTIIFAVAAIIAAYMAEDDAFSRDDGWRYAAIVVGAYVVSRGLAKLGVHEPYSDDDDR